MIPMKKYFTDSLIQLAIVLSLLRTDLNHLMNSGISSYPEVQEIMLGQSFAYTQTNFHSQNLYNTFEGIGHVHPKSIDNSFYSDVLSDIHRLSHRFQPRHEDVISAWLVDGQSYQTPAVADTVVQPAPVEENNNEPSSHASLTPVGTATETESEIGSETPSESGSSVVVTRPGAELTKEDMDLIEILWHQDIDLGIGRDGFDAGLRQELEKERELEERKRLEETKKLEQQDSFDWESYIVDGETGELIPSNNAQQQTNYTEDNSTNLNDAEHSISIVDALAQLNTSEPAQPLAQRNNSLTQLLTTTDEQIDKELDDLIQNVQQNDTQFDRQTSIEQRWNDISSLLNLTNGNNSLIPINNNGEAPIMDIDMGTGAQQGMVPATSRIVSNANSALIQNASFAPVNVQADYHLSQLMGFDQVAPAVPPMPVAVNNSSPSMYYHNEDDGALFPDVPNMVNESSYYDQSDFLTDIMEEELDNEMARFNLGTNTQNLQMRDVSDDSAVSSMGSLSPGGQDWNDTQSTNGSTGMTSPFDGLEGATGGSYTYMTGHQNIRVKSESEYSSGSAESYYLDASDVEMNATSNHSTEYKPALHRHVNHNHTYPLQPGQQPRERKSDKKADPDRLSMSRDEKRLKTLKVPFTLGQIVHSAVDDFNEMLKKHKLSDEQMSLVRDVRRRGKNKVAAQNCRKRKLTVVTTLEDDVGQMKDDKQKATKMRNMLDKELRSIRDKYDHLYQEMFRSLRDANGRPFDAATHSLQHTQDGDLIVAPTNNTQERQTPQRVTKKRKSNRKN